MRFAVTRSSLDRSDRLPWLLAASSGGGDSGGPRFFKLLCVAELW